MRRTLVAVVTLAVAAMSFGVHAQAAPKGFTKTVIFTDTTPDPTGYRHGTNEEHCLGVLPMEAPIVLKVPAAGTVDVALSGFLGDWTLMITDPAGEIITGADVDPPAFESAGFKVKKASTVHVHPCNFAGTPESTVTIKWTPKK